MKRYKVRRIEDQVYIYQMYKTGLSVTKLSDELGVPEKLISQIVNKGKRLENHNQTSLRKLKPKDKLFLKLL